MKAGARAIAVAIGLTATISNGQSPESLTLGATGDSEEPVVSADGRYVAFMSEAGDLVGGDTNDSPDVFVIDRNSGSVRRVSETAAGEGVMGLSGGAMISAAGDLIMFTSNSDELTNDPDIGFFDVFVKSLTTGAVEKISGASDGGAGDGTTLGSDFSADGRFITLTSTSTNLTATPINDGIDHAYLHDRNTGTTEIVSLATGGALANGNSIVPAVSDDGRYVAFESEASNLGTALPGVRQIFVRDRTMQTTTPVCVDSGGGAANEDCFDPVLSADGNLIFFYTNASNLAGDTATRVYFFDQTAGAVTLLPVNDRMFFASEPAISADGRYVIMQGVATGDIAENIYFYDRVTDEFSLVSQGPGVFPADEDSANPEISDTGLTLVFDSEATNLDPADSDILDDVYLVSRAVDLIFGNGFEQAPES